MNNIKIFVCHTEDDRFFLPPNRLFCHVLGGASLRAGKPVNLSPDNTGENISAKNKSFCELTVQYWAWKNADLDYYGFCHYRRYFGFNVPENQLPDKYSNTHFDCFDENLINQIISSPLGIIEKMNNSPLAMTEPFDVRNDDALNVYDHYAKGIPLSIGDLDILLDVINDVSPEFSPAAKEFVEGYLLYPCNMFIMKKDLFRRYCEWLFLVLEECEKRIDVSNYTIDKLRVFGHLAERCLGIFYQYINKNENIEAVFFQRLVIRDVNKAENIAPRFKNAVTIAAAANNYYVPYTAVMIQSVLENASPDEQYEIYILHTDINTESQKRIKLLSKKFRNCFIGFFDMTENIACFPFKKSDLTPHITAETFYRTLIHKIFGSFERVLYIDSDIIARADISRLFHADIGDKSIGACVDGDFIGAYRSEPGSKNYADLVLRLQNPLQYFQAGVMLIDINRVKNEYDDYFLANMAIENNYKWGDQDIFNVCFQNKVSFLELKWNVLVQHKFDRIARIREAPYHIYQEYTDSRDDPKIIHYAGKYKPWDDLEMDFAEEFWNVARRSPFYEVLLRRLMEQNSREAVNTIKPMEMLDYSVITENIILKKLLKKIINSVLRKVFPG